MQTLEKDQADLLTNLVLSQAKLFLDDAGEFFPFATAIDKNNNIKPVGVFFENDNPNSSEVFNFLEKVVRQNLSNGVYISAAIGLDVYITNNGEKRTAIQITFYSKNESRSEIHLYVKNEAGYSFLAS